MGDSRHGMTGWSVRSFAFPCHARYPLPVTLMAIIMTIPCIPPNACFVVTYFAVGEIQSALSSLLQTSCVREAHQVKSASERASEQAIWVSFQIGLASVVVVVVVAGLLKMFGDLFVQIFVFGFVF